MQSARSTGLHGSTRHDHREADKKTTHDESKHAEFIEESKSLRSSRETTARACDNETSEMKSGNANGFVNHGLRRWEEGRAKWLRLGENNIMEPRRPQPILDDEVIYETIFSKPIGWLLPHPVRLAHMVELLEDEWSD